MYKVCSNVDGLIAIATEQLNYGKAFTCNKEPVTNIIPFGYETIKLTDIEMSAELDWLASLGVDFSKKSVCFIGTLGRFFNLETVFSVAKKMPDVQFLMAGKGDLEAGFKAATESIPNIFWLGWVNQPKIQAIMKVSHIGLGPYKKGSFSLTNKPIEYISGGLPVVHSIRGDFKVYSERYGCGKYYDDEDAVSLQAALEYYLNNDELLQTSSNNAVRCFSENFQLNAVTDKFETFFSKIL